MTNSSNQLAAYFHIPFCEHICYYCNFNKVFLEGQPVDEYIEALLKETALTKAAYPYENLETIYLGGGTPTSLSAKQLDRLLGGIEEILPLGKGKEFTIEANPGDLTEDKIEVFQNYGVNRISLGVQTFHDKLLKKIGRKHSVQDVYDTIGLLRKHGFENISIDLIYALPGQDMEMLEESLNQALTLDLPHYSLYSLILENQTMFMNWVRQGRLELPTDDAAADMFEKVLEMMEKHQRYQYEISNFAKKGFESQHNLMYWNNEHYYGLGAGASGYLGKTRYKNHGPIQHYLKPLKEDKLPIIEVETLTKNNQMEEEMFLGLRKREGVSTKAFSEKFQRPFDEVYGKVTKSLLDKGLLGQKEDRIFLTPKSLFVGNVVFEEFLIDKK